MVDSIARQIIDQITTETPEIKIKSITSSLRMDIPTVRLTLMTEEELITIDQLNQNVQVDENNNLKFDNGEGSIHLRADPFDKLILIPADKRKLRMSELVDSYNLVYKCYWKGFEIYKSVELSTLQNNSLILENKSYSHQIVKVHTYNLLKGEEVFSFISDLLSSLEELLTFGESCPLTGNRLRQIFLYLSPLFPDVIIDIVVDYLL